MDRAVLSKKGVLFSSSSNAKELKKRLESGELKQVHQKIYVNTHERDTPATLRRYWRDIAEHLYPEAIVSFRTALEMKPHEGHVFLSYSSKRRYKIELPGLTLNLLPCSSDAGVIPFGMKIRISSLSRALLENLQPARVRTGISKALGKEAVESKLCKEMNLRGEESLNVIRDEAKGVAQKLGLHEEFEQLNAMISALLSSRPHEGALRSDRAISIAQREPYDVERLAMFEQLAAYLRLCTFKKRAVQYEKVSWRNFSFFESYFSNYIEGTEFELDEAEEIVFSRKEIGSRHADSHDIMAIYALVNDHSEMVSVPNSADELLSLLKRRHEMIMAARAEKNPGEFKEKKNRAGNTSFVLPEHVNATLTRAFNIYQTLPEGMHRALFIHFVISECHPFNDGNGRISRIMMNAELVSIDEYRIIVPTVMRDSYIGGLRQVSRTISGRAPFRTMVKTFDQCHAYSAAIPWVDYEDTRNKIEQDMANLTPDEGLGTFNKLLRNFQKSDYPVG
ncbi:MAG: Fic family protein [Mariprofundaceae bacterium]